MKLFTGLVWYGEVIHWLPPSEARGRPVGFWTSSGYDIECMYEGFTYWAGSENGLIALYHSHDDQNGLPGYSTFWQVSYQGEQVPRTEGGYGEWIDEWIVEDNPVNSCEVSYGYENYWLKGFKSSYDCYLNHVEGNILMRRQDIKNVVLPMIPRPDTFHMPKMIGTTPYG